MLKPAENKPKALMCPTFEMMRCDEMVLIIAPTKKQEPISPINTSPTLICFKITPTELTMRALPMKTNAIPTKSAVIDLMVRFELIIFFLKFLAFFPCKFSVCLKNSSFVAEFLAFTLKIQHFCLEFLGL